MVGQRNIKIATNYVITVLTPVREVLTGLKLLTIIDVLVDVDERVSW